MYEIVVRPKNAAEMFRRFRLGAPKAMLNAGWAVSMQMRSLAVREGFENKNPPYLNRRTGNAIRSVQATGTAEQPTPEVTWAKWGSNLDYVKAHEEGWAGVVQVRAHVRKGHQVRSHPRNVKVRARWMFRDSLNRNAGKPAELADAALDLLLKNRKVPTAGEILRAVGGLV